jgi:hypothetical protein
MHVYGNTHCSAPNLNTLCNLDSHKDRQLNLANAFIGQRILSF